MPNTKGYPRTKKGKNSYVSLCISTMKKEHPDRDLKAIEAACEQMWRSRWNKKESKASEEQICLECEKAEDEANGIWEIDITTARKIIQCNNCNSSISLIKPKKDEPENESISAQMTINGRPFEGHFCSSDCLRDFLNKRIPPSKKKNK